MLVKKTDIEARYIYIQTFSTQYTLYFYFTCHYYEVVIVRHIFALRNIEYLNKNVATCDDNINIVFKDKEIIES